MIIGVWFVVDAPDVWEDVAPVWCIGECVCIVTLGETGEGWTLCWFCVPVLFCVLRGELVELAFEVCIALELLLALTPAVPLPLFVVILVVPARMF